MKRRHKSLAAILARRKRLLATSTVVGVVIAMIAFKLSPKTYKVQTTISIETQYFQVPMVSDFVPQTYDESELRSQRESLVRESLDYGYLRELGTKFNLFDGVSPRDVTTYDLNKLAKRFEIVNLNAMTFLVSFLGPDPVLGYKVVQDYTEHLRKTIESGRRTMLSQLRNAIKDQLEHLAFAGKGGGDDIMLSRPDLVKQEAAREEDELKRLRSVYSSRHPRVLELQAKLNRLSRYLKPKDIEKTLEQEQFSSARLDPGSQELFRDLLKKYHYISVVMYMDALNHDSYVIQLQQPFVPRAPIRPKRPLYFAWGVALGLLAGAFVSLWKESTESAGEEKTEREHEPASSDPFPRVARVPVAHSERS